MTEEKAAEAQVEKPADAMELETGLKQKVRGLAEALKAMAERGQADKVSSLVEELLELVK